MPEKSPVFVRDATGLVRSFGVFDTYWIVSLGFGQSVLSSLLFFVAYFYVVGAGIWAIALANFIAAPLGFIVYWPMMQMSIAMPRSGGDYVYVSRTIHPAIGFMNNFVFTIAAMIGLGISAPYVVSLCLSAPFYMLSLQTGNQSLQAIAAFTSQPWPAFMLGTLILFVVFAVLTLGSTALKAFNRMTLVVFILGTILIFGVMLWFNNSDFVAGINSMAPQTNVTVDKIFAIAKATGWPKPDNGLNGVVNALPLAMFTYYGMAFGTYFGGEIKNIAKTQPIVVLAQIVTSGIYWIVILTLMGEFFGENLFSAFSWIVFGPGGSSAPWPTLMPPTVLMFILSPTGQWLFHILVMIIWIQWFIFFWMSASRNLFAWGFDRVMPAGMTTVSERFKSPIYTGITVFILAEIFQYLFVFTTVFTGQFNFLLFLTSALVIPSLAAAVFPYRKKDMFNSSHKLVRMKVGPIPLITILGIAGAIIMVVNTVVMLQLPFLGPANPVAFGFFIGLYVLGLVVFYVAKGIRKSQGIELASVFKELPPD